MLCWRRATRRSRRHWPPRPGATAIACDATRAADVERQFAAIDGGGERLDLVIYNASGLVQRLVRELQPQNIHVGHIVIDGGIGRPGDRRGANRGPDALLDPEAIADSYFDLHCQQRSAWVWEIELRPWIETF